MAATTDGVQRSSDSTPLAVESDRWQSCHRILCGRPEASFGSHREEERIRPWSRFGREGTRIGATAALDSMGSAAEGPGKVPRSPSGDLLSRGQSDARIDPSIGEIDD